MKKIDPIEAELKINENELLMQMDQTKKRKAQFIYEIKAELGKEIKVNPRAVKIIKLTFSQKLKTFLINLFIKF